VTLLERAHCLALELARGRGTSVDAGHLPKELSRLRAQALEEGADHAARARRTARR
jgi:hypothetical protein